TSWGRSARGRAAGPTPPYPWRVSTFVAPDATAAPESRSSRATTAATRFSTRWTGTGTGRLSPPEGRVRLARRVDEGGNLGPPPLVAAHVRGHQLLLPSANPRTGRNPAFSRLLLLVSKDPARESAWAPPPAQLRTPVASIAKLASRAASSRSGRGPRESQ